MSQDTSTEIIPADDLSLEPARSQQSLARTLDDMRGQVKVLQRFIGDVMIDGQDYGKIPGTDKPTLLKPGAEKLLNLYRYAPVVADLQITQNEETGFMRALVVMRIQRREDKVIVAEGVGEANTNEGKHRWRWLWDNDVKALGLDPKILPSKTFKSRQGKDFTKYRVDNDDPWTLWNTILKMAKKRALVDATLSATWTSGIFAQDMEDLHHAEIETPSPVPSGESTGALQDTSSAPPTEPGNGTGNNATPAQCKALAMLAGKRGYDAAEMHKRAKVASLKDLTKKAASDLIKEWGSEQVAAEPGADSPKAPDPEPQAASDPHAIPNPTNLPDALWAKVIGRFEGRTGLAQKWAEAVIDGVADDDLEVVVTGALARK